MADKASSASSENRAPRYSLIRKVTLGGYLLFGLFGGILIATDPALSPFWRAFGLIWPVVICYLIFLLHEASARAVWRVFTRRSS